MIDIVDPAGALTAGWWALCVSLMCWRTSEAAKRSVVVVGGTKKRRRNVGAPYGDGLKVTWADRQKGKSKIDREKSQEDSIRFLILEL
jgi:hypothetical protein